MADHKDSKSACFLISIEATNRDALFDCYRDYLVFMSLVRDGVRGCQYKVYGFCWLKKRCLMLVQPENPNIGKSLLRLLKRYHFWLLQQGPSTTEYKLQMVKLEEKSWTLDCLRYLHQQAVKERIVEDAMDYHWHSYHVYNGFWSINWLDTAFILEMFAGNRLVAMNRYRQYMLHGCKLDFSKMLDSDDCSQDFISPIGEKGLITGHQEVAEVNNLYHQSLLERTQIDFVTKNNQQLIRVCVTDAELLEEENPAEAIIRQTA